MALVTPFLEDGSVDWESLQRLLLHVAPHVQYLVVNGTTAESATLSHAEQEAVLHYVLENRQAQVPVVFGLGGNNTASIIERAKNLPKGVDAILSVTPYYNKPSQAGIMAHYRALADACPVPVVLYNVPGRTSVNLSADSTLALAEHPNIIGIKEASGDMEQCMRIIAEAPKGFALISGDDLLTTPLISVGAIGVISVLANGIPAYFCQMVNAALNQEFGRAKALVLDMLPLNKLMYQEGNPSGIKTLLELIGVCYHHTRLPVVPGTHALRASIYSELDELRAKYAELVG